MGEQNKFASQDLEGSNRHATGKDDYLDNLEPLDEPIRDAVAEAVGEILRQIMTSKATSLYRLTPEIVNERLQVSFRSFVALIQVIRPDLLPGGGALPSSKLAQSLGISRACLSRLATSWSRMVGIRGAGMKSLDAREVSRVAAQGRKGAKTPKRDTPGLEGELTDSAIENRTRRILAEAMAYFHEGKPWTKLHRRELRWAGLVDIRDKLTKEGREALESYALEPQ